MALSETLVIADEANVAKNFVQIERSGTLVRRIDDASNLSLPVTCVISHNTSGKGDSIVDRHLVQFAKTELDTNGAPVTSVVNMTIAAPRALTSSLATSQELVGYAVNFLLGVNAARSFVNLPAITIGES